MIGRRPTQQNLFSADTQYLQFVGSDSFYGFLARHSRELFPDWDFAELYCPDFGRPSVPPSLLAIAPLLQAHDWVSDAEATRRAAFDMCRKVALSVEMDGRPFAKSTLQLFRAQLLIHDQARAIFTRSLEVARQTGYVQARGSGQPDAGGRLGGLRGHVWGLFGAGFGSGRFLWLSLPYSQPASTENQQQPQPKIDPLHHRLHPNPVIPAAQEPPFRPGF